MTLFRAHSVAEGRLPWLFGRVGGKCTCKGRLYSNAEEDDDVESRNTSGNTDHW